MTSKLKPAILIISETASKDPSTDRSSAVLSDVFKNVEGDTWTSPTTKIVKDDVREIQAAIQAWTDMHESAVNLIVTSGGTGFTETDVTPEAVSPLLQKQAPGLVHGMLAASLAVTPFAIMSRPVAGVRHKTLILTLPGSPKGAKENLQSVLKLLPHACQQAAGANSRQLHVGGVERLEKDAGLHKHDQFHSHHHHSAPRAHTSGKENGQSNDPSLGPTRRYRSSPFPMLSVDEALEKINLHTPDASIIEATFGKELIGSVLAEDVRAPEAVPAFRASIVDGYAVCIPDGNPTNEAGVFSVAFAGHAHAGDVPELKQGSISRITTGAPLPPGSNAVVMVEDTVLVSKTEDGKEEAEVEILTSDVKIGENIREIGSDVAKGDVIMRKHEGITSIGGEFGLLASAGVRKISVYGIPCIGVMSTGDEIVPWDREGKLKLGEVRDTNRPLLITAVEAQGYPVVDLGIVSDKPRALEDSLRKALSEVNILITTGGVSMGELDLLKPTIERSLGGTIHFGRVSMKPGKPTTFATIPGADGGRDKVIFSLPGNPASAVVTFMLFVLPSIHKLAGIKPAGLPRISVRLDGPVTCDASREEYHRVILSGKSSTGDDGLWAMSTGGQRSSRIGSFKGANALLKLPAGGGILERGSKVEALLMSTPVS